MIFSMFISRDIIDIYAMLLFMRLWIEWALSDVCNPMSIIIINSTKITIFPLISIITNSYFLYILILLEMYILLIFKYCFLYFLKIRLMKFEYIYLIMGIFSLIKSYGYIIFWNVTIRSFISWVNRKVNVMEYFFIELTEPIMKVCRHLVPKIGNIDISAMVIVLVLYFLNFIGASIFPNVWYLL
ncbi:YGGT family protein [Candidatus Annandia adelgestsuga]|uniref:YGGT family protein n=1 Tax=Candidatus Annandia adelgestsuga TaxID=1302411 RepID=A0A3Q9CKS4_9ENTR|nr:YggT family protein [Candidatus Annandia adelgestsuga]AZP36265.1 YGGT family protein [Candidatus Annandia adelgestsuga]